MSTKNKNNPLRLKLKATIEASRISRLKRDDQDDILREMKKDIKDAEGGRKEWLQTLAQIIEEKQEAADEVYSNMQFGAPIDGGNGLGWGGGDGRDSG